MLSVSRRRALCGQPGYRSWFLCRSCWGWLGAQRREHAHGPDRRTGSRACPPMPKARERRVSEPANRAKLAPEACNPSPPKNVTLSSARPSPKSAPNGASGVAVVSQYWAAVLIMPPPACRQHSRQPTASQGRAGSRQENVVFFYTFC